MNGIVLEIRNKDAVVLFNDGVVRKIKNHNYKIGEIVVVKVKQNRSALIKWGAGVAAAFIFSATGAYAYTKPAGYISLDVDPSIEYSINMFDRVLEAKSVNENGEDFLAELKLRNMHIEAAIEKTTAKLIEKNYISDDAEGNVVITTSAADTKEAEKLADQLKGKILEYINKEGKAADIEADAVGLERVKKARELGVTPGKLNLVEKLIASSDNPDDIDMQEWLTKSPKEINKAIKENRKALRNNNSDTLDEDELVNGEDAINEDELAQGSSDTDNNASDNESTGSDINTNGNKDDSNDSKSSKDVSAQDNFKSQAIGLKRVEKARELGVTPGKINLMEKLIKSSDNSAEIHMEEWLNKSAKEINKEIKDNRKALKDNTPGQPTKNKLTEDRENKKNGKGSNNSLTNNSNKSINNKAKKKINNK